MNLNDFPEGQAKKRIVEHYDAFPYLEVRYSELKTFSSALLRQPQLRSSYNDKLEAGKSIFDVLCLYHRGVHAGSLSFFLERNEMRKNEADHFGRIDIVIVETAFQRKAVGKLLVITAITYLLDRWGPIIYSLSCLAAHEAMAKILEEIGFEGEQRTNEAFIRETLSFENVNRDEFSALLNTRLAKTIQLVNYRLL